MVYKAKTTDSILSTLTKFIMGFLGSLMTFIILLKFASSIWGVIVGILVSTAIGIYLIKKHQQYKIVAYGVIAASIFIIIAAITIWIFVFSAFQGIAG